MKLIIGLMAIMMLAACASPAPSKPAEKPHSTERSDQAYEELDKEMNKY